MKRMFPFPFPIVPIGFGLLFLIVWAAGPASSTPGTVVFPPLAAIIAVVLIATAAVVVVAAVAVRNRRSDKQDTTNRIGRTRTMTRQQLDAVANDILRLEDETRASGTDEARAHFRAATIAYAESIGEFEATDAITDLSALARRLDTAIWHLDATDAILGEEPIPPQPRTTPMTVGSTTRERDRRATRRRSAAGVFGMVTSMLEDGSMAQPVPTVSSRSRSRRHC